MAEVIMPKMGDGMAEGTLLSWKKQDGDQVKSGDVIAEIETDKSNVELEAEDAGVLRIRVQVGSTVPVGEVIATIGDTAAVQAPSAVAAKPAAAPAPAPKAAEASRPAIIPGNNGHDRIKASPLARRVAREQGIDIAQVKGTGPFGRVVEADVAAFAKQRGAQPSATPIAQPSGPAPAPVELSAMRRVIAKRMVESKTQIPHFYVTIEIDMTEAVALREKLNSYDETLPKISFNDMVVKASAKALAKVPGANAAFRDDKIFPGNGIHVGIAVALDDGLIVPVVRDADKLPLRALAQTSKDLIKKARDKKLQPNEYSSGTFTVSNLGSFDVENFIAIIDPAQGAILAVSSIVKKPVVLDDGQTIAVRDRMNVTFSGDHRVMDGAVGAKFGQELKRILQNPLSLME
jgi:pyruvate dehydrogenase E2 component (dihydrolipoamide acetyltransferase)